MNKIRPCYQDFALREAIQNPDRVQLLLHPNQVDLNFYEDYSIPLVLYRLFIRKLTTEKMNYLKIYTREFMSDNEEQIFVVMKPMITLISQQASKQGMQKEVELACVDAFSLLPVDKRLRPIIYKPHFFKELL